MLSGSKCWRAAWASAGEQLEKFGMISERYGKAQVAQSIKITETEGVELIADL
jgi:hypothetical protein